MNFASDNCAGIAPEILAAITEANAGYHHSYGGDPWTARLNARFSEIFERDVDVFPVLTGGAANCLALASVTPPYGAIYCHEQAHIQTDECGAIGLYTGGAKLNLLTGAHGKIDPAALRAALEAPDRGVHQTPAAALSLTQATEAGTLYTLDHIAELAALARSRDLPVHMDGARIANAIAALGCTPADVTWRAGVDMLSFGATKNGAMLAEAVVFFDKDLARAFAWRRKQAGQLLSKMRFVSAQLDAYLADGLWLRLAAHANAMAAKLATELKPLPFIGFDAPVEANELFVNLPEAAVVHLEAEGADFYRWERRGEAMSIRLVTNFATTEDEVARFIGVLGAWQNKC